jgi:hypothetical protein
MSAFLTRNILKKMDKLPMTRRNPIDRAIRFAGYLPYVINHVPLPNDTCHAVAHLVDHS